MTQETLAWLVGSAVVFAALFAVSFHAQHWKPLKEDLARENRRGDYYADRCARFGPIFTDLTVFLAWADHRRKLDPEHFCLLMEPKFQHLERRMEETREGLRQVDQNFEKRLNS